MAGVLLDASGNFEVLVFELLQVSSVSSVHKVWPSWNELAKVQPSVPPSVRPRGLVCSPCTWQLRW